MSRSKPKPLIDENGELRDITEADARLFRVGRPPLAPERRKRRTTIMLDPDVIDRLKADGRGSPTRANRILRDALGL